MKKMINRLYLVTILLAVPTLSLLRAADETPSDNASSADSSLLVPRSLAVQLFAINNAKVPPSKRLTSDFFFSYYNNLLKPDANGNYSLSNLDSVFTKYNQLLAEAKKLPTPKSGFQGFKIRASFSDVLSSEDPTVSTDNTSLPQPVSPTPTTPTTKPKAGAATAHAASGGTTTTASTSGASTSPSSKTAVTDITGATLSYTKNFKTGADAWVVKGAVLAPFVKFTDAREFSTPQLATYGVIPSVSVDREINEANKSSEVNSLIFRSGFFMQYLSDADDNAGLYSQSVRLYGTYGTDLDFKSEIPAVEFEYEPCFLTPYFATGTSQVICGMQNLCYMFRLYIHGEYGDINYAQSNTGVYDGDFLRIGPKAQFTLNPFFTSKLSLVVSEQYLPDIIGRNERNNHIQADLEYKLNDDKPSQSMDKAAADKSFQYTLKATYEDGGIDLSKQNVQTFYIGLGISL